LSHPLGQRIGRETRVVACGDCSSSALTGWLEDHGAATLAGQPRATPGTRRADLDNNGHIWQIAGMSGIRDQGAGDLLADLRVERGLTREDVPHAMRKAGIDRHRIPSPKTLWRIETKGHVPGVRIQFALAQFYGREVRSIWAPQRRRVAA
jgi:hypothetical protein